MLIAQSPMNKTIETPAYNMASIMVFPFQLYEQGVLIFKIWLRLSGAWRLSSLPAPALEHEPQSNKVQTSRTGFAQRQPFRPAHFSKGRRTSQQNWGGYIDL
jgi:hypothetical protein